MKNDECDPWPHSTKSAQLLGRRRQLVANDDFSQLLLVDDGGGFEPSIEDLYRVINDLIERQ